MKTSTSSSHLASRISHLASRISHLAVASRRSTGCAIFLVILVSLFSTVGFVANASAIVTNVVYLGPTTFAGCGSDACCQAFRVYANAGEEIVITLNPNYSAFDVSCLDAGCWHSQGDMSTPGGLFNTELVTDSLVYICHALGTSGVDSFTVYICGTIDCWRQFPTFNWSINDNPHAGDVNLALSPCTGKFENCAGCPWINAYDMGCYDDIVFHNTSNNCLGSFQLLIQPALKNCNGATDNPTGGPMKCPGSTITLIPYSHQLNWNWSLGAGDSVLTIYNTDSFHTCMPTCSNFHIFIPKCNTQANHTFTVLPIIFPCNEHTTIALKQGTRPAQIDQGDANFPNPLDAAGGFKTTIPFSTSGADEAVIEIVSESGQHVLTETMQALMEGKHYFYFTGARLPSGQYFYRIEAPRGNVIASRTFLLVR